MKRFFLITLILFLETLMSSAQEGTEGTFVKAIKETYKKTSGLSFNYVSYTNVKDSLLNTPQTRKQIDPDARIVIPTNKILYSIIINTITSEQLKKVSPKGRIFVNILINSNGTPSRVSFMLPAELEITPKQVEILETQIKKQFKVQLVAMKSDKKFLSYGLPVLIAKLLDGTYSY